MLSRFQLLAVEVFDGNGDPPQTMTENLRKVLGFVSWSITGVFILSLLLIAAQAAIAHRRGDGQEHLQGLMWVAFGCLLGGSASSIAEVVVD